MTRKKSLQKVTDIEKLKTVKDIREYVKDNPLKADEVLEKLQDLLNKSYAEKLGLEHEVVELVAKCYTLLNLESRAEFVKNTTYETNHTIIATFIHNHICNNRYFPSIMTIKKETGLSRQTVYRHINNGFNDKFNSVVRGKIEYMIPKALEKLYYIGVQDNNATALKHFINLSGITLENKTTNVNNYIQINNLKLSKDEFEQLPNETILEIENIISKSISK
tara:strand:+ start:7409 stop:8071 length:663 start_codon:yes stop_codon:yes gene_type:complete